MVDGEEQGKKEREREDSTADKSAVRYQQSKVSRGFVGGIVWVVTCDSDL